MAYLEAQPANLELVTIQRVSTKEQAEEGRGGLPRQAATLKRIIKREGLAPGRVHEVDPFIDVSGRSLGKTPEWREQVVPLLRRPNVHLAVDDVDRLCRAQNLATDLRVLQDIQETGTLIYDYGGVWDLSDPRDLESVVTRALRGGNEMERLSRKAREAKEEKRKMGQFPGSKICLATGIDYDHKTKVWSLTDAIDGPIRAFHLFGEEGVESIARIGRLCGVSGPTVRGWLRNTIYKGIMTWEWERGGDPYQPQVTGRQPDKRKTRRDEVISRRVFPVDDQPVSDALWDRVQRRLDDLQQSRRKRKAKTSSTATYSSYMFSAYERLGPQQVGFVTLGLVERQKPKHIIYARSAGKGGVQRYVCRCAAPDRGPTSPTDKCGLSYLRADEVNKALDCFLERLCTQPHYKDTIEEALGSAGKGKALHERTLKQLKDRLLEVRKGQQRLTDALIRGTVPEDIHDTEARKLNKQRADLLKEIDRLGEERGGGPDRDEIRAAVAQLTFDASWTPARKRRWLSRHVRRMRVSNEGIESVTLHLPGTMFVYSGMTPWADLVGYDITDPTARWAANGELTAAHVAKELGLPSAAAVRYRVKAGILPDPKGRKGDKRVWTPAEVAEAKAILSRPVDTRWGVPMPEDGRWSRGMVAKALGVNGDRVRYLEKTKRIPAAHRDDRGVRYWTTEQVAEMLRAGVA